MSNARMPKLVTLADGLQAPRLAFGTASKIYRKPCTDIVLKALENGFRHIDTAQTYLNEESVGEAIKQWGGRREDIFITTKWGHRNAPSDPTENLHNALDRLGVDYVDLYLFHEPKWPCEASLEEAWAQMEQLKHQGLCRSIGVSNFEASHIKRLAKAWRVKPSVNQVEWHPYYAHQDVMVETARVCKEHEIPLSGFAPLVPLYSSTDGPVDPVVQTISENRLITRAQVLFLWAMQTVSGPIQTSSRREDRMKEALAVLDLESLTQGEVDAISEAGKGRSHREY